MRLMNLNDPLFPLSRLSPTPFELSIAPERVNIRLELTGAESFESLQTAVVDWGYLAGLCFKTQHYELEADVDPGRNADPVDVDALQIAIDDALNALAQHLPEEERQGAQAFLQLEHDPSPWGTIGKRRCSAYLHLASAEHRPELAVRSDASRILSSFWRSHLAWLEAGGVKNLILSYDLSNWSPVQRSEEDEIPLV